MSWLKYSENEPIDMQQVLMTLADWHGFVITARYDCDVDDKSFTWTLPNGHVIRSFRPKDGDIYWMPMPDMPED